MGDPQDVSRGCETTKKPSDRPNEYRDGTRQGPPTKSSDVDNDNSDDRIRTFVFQSRRLGIFGLRQRSECLAHSPRGSRGIKIRWHMRFDRVLHCRRHGAEIFQKELVEDELSMAIDLKTRINKA